MLKKVDNTELSSGEHPFIPRIINPLKIKSVIIFSADEKVRNVKNVFDEEMPWIDCEVFTDPISVSKYRSGRAAVFIFDDAGINIVDTLEIQQGTRDAVVVLLTSNGMIQCSPPSVAEEKFPYTAKADLVFAYNSSDCAPETIISSVVRVAEDLLNITNYSKARRYIFLLVDDEPRWFSQFLPVLYGIIGQRADVMLARTYEEALLALFGVDSESEIDKQAFYQNGHGDDVVCLITDIFFPKGEELDSPAGKDLVRLMNTYYPRAPIVIASKTKEADNLKDITFVLPKGDPGSLDTLRSCIRDRTGMGDFIIFGEGERELYRVKNLKEMIEVLNLAQQKTSQAAVLMGILEDYGDKDNFSTWLYMHSFRELADELRPMRASGRRLITVLKKYLSREKLRMERTPLIIDGVKVFDLQDLAHLLGSVDPKNIQEYSDNDIISSWLDRKGFTELADELRPIHGSGEKLTTALAKSVKKWKR